MNEELTFHDLKEEKELSQSLANESKYYLVSQIIMKNRQLDVLERENSELIDENQQLKSQLKQNNDVIDETTTIINQYKNFCKRNIEEEAYDNISKQSNVHWNYCIDKLDYVLSILNKRGGISE